MAKEWCARWLYQRMLIQSAAVYFDLFWSNNLSTGGKIKILNIESSTTIHQTILDPDADTDYRYEF